MRQRLFALRYLLIAVFVFLFDQMIKRVIRSYPYGRSIWHLYGLFDLVRFGNTGAAFSMFSGKTDWITLFSAGILVALAVYLLQNLHLTAKSKLAIALLIGGGTGNLADRLMFGEVTDYIRLLIVDFPVFNLADVMITGSVLYLAYELLTGKLDRLQGE